MYNNQPSIPSASYHHHQPMANHRIHGNVLEVNVICCYKLKDTEWISRQDPYVCVEYGNNRSRTRTNTDGGKNPTFQEKFVYGMIEGLRELNIMVWNSNILSHDDFIGSGKVQLAKVISHGFDDSSWPLQSKTGRYAGEVRLIMHYNNVNNHANSYATSAPPYGASGPPHVPMYSPPPPPPPPPHSSMSYPPPYLPAGAYPAPPAAYSFPPNSGGYPPPSPYPYPPDPYSARPYGYPGGYPPPY
ncbi:protein SRC2 [Lactuca sativa]|uniref:protein SRC2 n=1 Tax=Lactuca sativa TaxID=4236 RepID=UPI000CD9F366|nr:protein SRC2 [Lactuca sativa]